MEEAVTRYVALELFQRMRTLFEIYSAQSHRMKVYEFLKIKEVLHAGSHGMDIIGPPQQANTSYGGKYETITLDENL